MYAIGVCRSNNPNDLYFHDEIFYSLDEAKRSAIELIRNELSHAWEPTESTSMMRIFELSLAEILIGEYTIKFTTKDGIEL